MLAEGGMMVLVEEAVVAVVAVGDMREGWKTIMGVGMEPRRGIMER